METIKVGKRGTIVLPAKLRKQFGIEEGTLVLADTRDGELRLRPAIAVEVEIYTPERIAGFLLNNALTQEEYDEAVAEVRAMGFDPLRIEGAFENRRDHLLSNAEFDRRMRPLLKREDAGKPAPERRSA